MLRIMQGAVHRTPLFAVGDRVIITDGDMQGMRGTIYAHRMRSAIVQFDDPLPASVPTLLPVVIDTHAAAFPLAWLELDGAPS